MTEESSSQTVRGTSILVAEDNDVVRKGLVNFLIKWGYSPVEVKNGDEAWNILENDPSIRLAVLDWNLPGLSGLQICQRIRIRTDGPYVYTIIFSSRKSKEEQVLALDAGADDYLVKPCKPSELRARLGAGRRIIDIALKETPASLPVEPESNTAPDQAEPDSTVNNL